MTFKAKAVGALVVVGMLAALGWAVNYYRDNAIEYKKQRDEKTRALASANATINDMQVRQRDVAALDAKYTGELADAKAAIDKLRGDVADGRRRLQLNASCKPVPGTTSTAGMDDASGPRLTDAAERDYFSLRERIETSGKQIAGLQDYIRQQCLK